jgi:hypothetical protein
VTQTERTSRLRQRSVRHSVAALAVGWCVLAPGPVRATPPQAEPHRRVLILVDKPGDPFMGRIKAEVVALGLEVAMRPPVGSIDADARAEHAVAAIRMLPSGKGVEVWMADETSGRSLLRQVIVDETPGGPDQNLIALQTAELLRTGFFPRSKMPASPASPPPAPPAIAASAPARPAGETCVQVGVGPLHSLGGASSALQAWLSIQHLWSQRFGIAVDLGAPIRRGTLSGPEGTSDVGAVVIGLELLAYFKSEPLFLSTGLGVAFADLLAQGHPSDEASAQLAGATSSAYIGLGYARLTTGWRPASWLGVGVSGLVGTTMGRVRIRFAGNDAGDWGVPLLAAFLFGEVAWR